MPDLVHIAANGEAAIPAAANPAGRIGSLLIKPVSALCNLDCTYCFYLDRESDPYQHLSARRMSSQTLERMVATFLPYSDPVSTFVFQGGEPTLAGLPFYEQVCALQQLYGRRGQIVSNSIQTNGVLLDAQWARLFRNFNWLVGLSLDGPREVNDACRITRKGTGSWAQAMRGLETLQKFGVAYNVLCVLTQANVEHPKELYDFFRALGVENLQFIPLAEFGPDGQPTPGSLLPDQYGKFLCELFEVWWPDRHRTHVRFFDNLAEALLDRKPSTCTMHTSCDSYAVVEYNGDVYPCDFFVETSWTLGNLHRQSWQEIAGSLRRADFAATKSIPHQECSVCAYSSICHGGCPKLRHTRGGRFEDLDYFCPSYKMIFARAEPEMRFELAKRLPKIPHSL